LLQNVEDTAKETQRLQAETDAARDQMYRAIRLAYDEGVSAAKIARSANLSAERVRQIVAKS
jgi:hypothetical protein